MRLSLIFAFTLVASTAVAQQAEITWDRKLWDPAEPVPGQIELPLPCGGAMVFLPVETPVEVDNPLADRQVRLGGADQETGYMDYFRTDYLRGGFVIDDVALFYLAKYEITRDQWTTVMGEACPDPSRGGTRPQGNVTWFDAVAFTRYLSEWLRLEAPDALPKSGDSPGFLRLPTETEWEFAARGGGRVDEADFRAALPPMDGPLRDYAWHYGPASANGAYRPVGTKLPNVLGFHGMLGGVEELALEPFRMNRLGRAHGQIGGFVTRGGSIETQPEALRSSLRAEWPYFNVVDGTATAFESFGLRPVVSAPVNVSLAYTNRVRDRWIADAQAEVRTAADPLGVLDQLAAAETDVRLKNELAAIRAEILSDRRDRDEAAARSLRLALTSGAALTNWMRQEIYAREVNERQLASIEDSLGDATLPDSLRARYEQLKPGVEQRLELASDNLALAESAFLASLYDIIDRHSDDEVMEQTDVLIIELSQREQESLAPAVRRYQNVVEVVRSDPGLPREEIMTRALE